MNLEQIMRLAEGMAFDEDINEGLNLKRENSIPKFIANPNWLYRFVGISAVEDIKNNHILRGTAKYKGDAFFWQGESSSKYSTDETDRNIELYCIVITDPSKVNAIKRENNQWASDKANVFIVKPTRLSGNEPWLKVFNVKSGTEVNLGNLK